MQTLSLLSEELLRQWLQCFDEVTPPTISPPTGCQRRVQLEGHSSWLKFHVLPQLATSHAYIGSYAEAQSVEGVCVVCAWTCGKENPSSKSQENSQHLWVQAYAFRKKSGGTFSYHDDQLFYISTDSEVGRKGKWYCVDMQYEGEVTFGDGLFSSKPVLPTFSILCREKGLRNEGMQIAKLHP